ncbi:MAG: BolA family transcriptional regulator [Pseudomonadales bacterium]|jgi:acid stress-induced BolA-like protein IbaG/YrbA|uniref:BolA family protein n=1 Tax=Halopseudomonas TaxID=2901189 RepID=UPI000C5C491A|nr:MULTISPECIES: BolA family protein [Halopseudomonas]MAD27710.1 BolA family transcriptional regulator [Pseudomonadales bacterium]MEE2798433.1 BolA family protein [Pseudomonadota bacterium]HBT57314.1 BolA family transcriptional regulator [Pseudomonas sp.]MAH00247.1 BolA family transcriptional regulator [Pseudomonadales bacterium]MAK72986.1 BolA family transcriptional regulator [Pseudomonadales bacterium]|tara:strand:+ start:10339 stop:10578 length:240 start_codon:yes stop_codon:yes gene_type:complete
MQSDEVKALIESRLEDARVEVEGEGCNFQLNVISDTLAALSPVKRQQQIYALLNDYIADGRIHAVTMKFYTQEAWASRA